VLGDGCERVLDRAVQLTVECIDKPRGDAREQLATLAAVAQREPRLVHFGDVAHRNHERTLVHTGDVDGLGADELDDHVVAVLVAKPEDLVFAVVFGATREQGECLERRFWSSACTRSRPNVPPSSPPAARACARSRGRGQDGAVGPDRHIPSIACSSMSETKDSSTPRASGSRGRDGSAVVGGAARVGVSGRVGSTRGTSTLLSDLEGGAGSERGRKGRDDG